MNFEIDSYAGSICKAGEVQCGGVIEIDRSEDGLSAVLTDGLGNGYRTTLIATVMARILLSCIKRGIPVEEAVKTVAQTIPVKREHESAYAAFTIVQILKSGLVRISEVNTPHAVILRRGKPFEVEFTKSFCGSLPVNIGTFEAKTYDTVTVFSDGLTDADGETMDSAVWQRNNVVAYLKALYKPHIEAKKITNLLLSVCNSLCGGRPKDDIDVVTFRLLKSHGKTADV